MFKRCENGCQYRWYDTSIGGFAQCRTCLIVDTSVKEEECVAYEDPAIALAATKAKKASDLEKRKAATIAYLKSKGLPYVDK